MPNNICATLNVVQGRPHSLSGRSAFHLALIAFTCAVMALLSVGSPTGLAGTDRLTRQIDHRAGQVGAPNHTAVATVHLSLRCAEGIHEQVVELTEPADEDDTDHYLLEVLRLAIVPFESQTGLSESSADRAVTPFLLRAFSSRGSPSA